MSPSQTSPAPITYYALDLERRELERTLDQLAASPVGREMHGKINTRGLWGTFEGGLKFVEEGGLRGRGVVAEAAARARSLSSDDGTTTQLSSASSEQDTAETPLSTPDLGTLETPLHLLFLGSSLANFSPGEDLAFLRSLPLRVGSITRPMLPKLKERTTIERALHGASFSTGSKVPAGHWEMNPCSLQRSGPTLAATMRRNVS
jgi:hypothetical protein